MIVFPHTNTTFAQSWTSTAIALYRDYLECQLMYYASFITVSSPTQVSGILVSSFQATLMQCLMRGSIVLNGFHFLRSLLLFKQLANSSCFLTKTTSFVVAGGSIMPRLTVRRSSLPSPKEAFLNCLSSTSHTQDTSPHRSQCHCHIT